jgi:hypothetical protein
MSLQCRNPMFVAALAVVFAGALDEARAASRMFQVHSGTASPFQFARPHWQAPGNVRLGRWQTLNSVNSVNSRNPVNAHNVGQAGQAFQPRIGAGSSTSRNTTARCAAARLCASDIRLKRDVVPLGRLGNGLGLYRYRYVWGEQVYVGVMAQEVAASIPDAVMRGADGHLWVDYARLGLRLATWEEWQAAR